jgi:hypothetical protein
MGNMMMMIILSSTVQQLVNCGTVLAAGLPIWKKQGGLIKGL